MAALQIYCCIGYSLLLSIIVIISSIRSGGRFEDEDNKQYK